MIESCRFKRVKSHNCPGDNTLVFVPSVDLKTLIPLEKPFQTRLKRN